MHGKPLRSAGCVFASQIITQPAPLRVSRDPGVRTPRTPRTPRTLRKVKGMEKIKDLVDKISSINEETEIHPGGSKEEISLKLKNAGLTPNELVLDVLSWADGIEGLDAFVRLMDVDSIVDVIHVWNKLKEDTADCDEPFTLPETLIPLIDVNGDTQYGIDTSNDAVYMVDMECDINQIICPDYRLMIDAIYKAIDTATFSFDEENGCFDCDEDKWQSIAKEFKITIPEE